MMHREQENFEMMGFYRLGGGYDNDAYLLAGILMNAAVNLKYRTGDYPEEIQQALRQFEQYALAKEDEVRRKRMKAEEAYYNGDCCALAKFADSGEAYGIIRGFDRHRLSPTFKSTSLNNDIIRARTEYSAAHQPKSKGFWESLFG